MVVSSLNMRRIDLQVQRGREDRALDVQVLATGRVGGWAAVVLEEEPALKSDGWKTLRSGWSRK